MTWHDRYLVIGTRPDLESATHAQTLGVSCWLHAQVTSHAWYMTDTLTCGCTHCNEIWSNANDAIDCERLTFFADTAGPIELLPRKF